MMIEPTVEQTEQCAIVQQELVETINRLVTEGIPFPVVSAGAAAAMAAMVQSFYGAGEVPKWFSKQAVMTMHFASVGKTN